MKIILSVILCVTLVCRLSTTLPMLPEPPEYDDYEADGINESNATAHDLYVIRTIVYEVGILTEAGNNTDSDDETFEEINFKFYDPNHNNTAFNLSSIPTPLETNFTAETITGLSDGSFGPIIPNYFFKEVTNISTLDPKEEREIIKHVYGVF